MKELIIKEARICSDILMGALCVFVSAALMAIPAGVVQASAPVPQSEKVYDCTYGLGYWKNHLAAWPVTSLPLGGATYSQSQLLDILNTPPHGDATYILAHQLIAAKLNVAQGADDSAVALTMAEADNWLSAHKLGSRPSGSDRSAGIEYSEALDAYNNGLIGPGFCDAESDTPTPTSVPPTATPTPTDTPTPLPPTATPTLTDTPTPVPPTATPTKTPTPADTTPPTGGILVNGGARESAHSRVLAQFWAIDDVGVTDMMLSVDASPTGTSWEPYTSSKELELNDGLHTIYVKYRDAAGKESPVYSQQITVTSRELPARISINDGAIWTNTPYVSLGLVGPLYTALMKISNDGGLAGSTWEPYQLRRAWTLDVLPKQTATYAVYAVFQDAWGGFSEVVNDTIIYDPIPPTGSVSLKNQVGQSTGSSTLNLTLSAQDDPNGSGVGQMRVSSNKGFSTGTGWIGYTTSYEWTAADKTVYVQFKDNAGNESEVYSLLIGGPQQSFTVYLPIIFR